MGGQETVDPRNDAENRVACQGTGLAPATRVGNPETNRPTEPSRKFARPLRDEWGIYDPAQVGLAVVVRRLLAARTDDDDVAAPAASDTVAK